MTRSSKDLAELEKMMTNCLECQAELNVCADHQLQILEDLPPGDAVRRVTGNNVYADDCIRHVRESHGLRLGQLKTAVGISPN
jgi:hypothetical protein